MIDTLDLARLEGLIESVDKIEISRQAQSNIVQTQMNGVPNQMSQINNMSQNNSKSENIDYAN